MRRNLPRWLYPPKFADEERTRVARLLNYFIWALIGVLILNTVSVVLASPQIDFTLWINGAVILLALGLRLLMQRGHVNIASFGFCIMFWGALAYYLPTSGGLRSPALMDLGVTVVIAAVLLGGRGTIIFGVICTLTVIVLYIGDTSGLFVSLEPPPTEGRLLSSTLTFVVGLAAFAAIGANSVSNALAQAQREIAERKRAQAELARLASIVETTLDYVGIADEHGKIFYINQGGRKLLGLPENVDVATTMIADLHPPEMAKMIMEQAMPIAADAGAWTGETILTLDDEREIPVLQTILAHRGESGTVTYYSTIMRDLSEHKQVEKQNLEFAVERERFTAFKEFLSTISHDLKTPLTLLDLNLHVLERLDDPVQQKRKINSIRDQTKLMEKYILDILAMSHLEQLPDLRLGEVNLAILSDAIVKQLQERATGKELAMTLTVIPDLPIVQGDADELSRALGNLVENAIAYTPNGGSVSVSADCEANTVLFCVADTGIGISAEALPHIFERSYRAREAKTFHSTGTGFGLAIVKKIIEMHHGRIEVQSTLGAGSTFRVYLPIAG